MASRINHAGRGVFVAPSAWPDNDLHVMTECIQELEEPIRGKPVQLAVDKGRDLRLVDPKVGTKIDGTECTLFVHGKEAGPNRLDLNSSTGGNS